MRFQDYNYFYEYAVLEISDIYIIYLNIILKTIAYTQEECFSKCSFGCVRSWDLCLKSYAAEVRFLSHVWHQKGWRSQVSVSSMPTAAESRNGAKLEAALVPVRKITWPSVSCKVYFISKKSVIYLLLNFITEKTLHFPYSMGVILTTVKSNLRRRGKIGTD